MLATIRKLFNGKSRPGSSTLELRARRVTAAIGVKRMKTGFGCRVRCPEQQTDAPGVRPFASLPT